MHKQLVIVAIVSSVVIAAFSSNSAWAGWGCAYSSSAGIGRMWGEPSEKAARSDTLHNCRSRNFKNCRIIGCSAHVNSKEDADKIWSRTPGIKYDLCGHPGQPKC